MQIKPRAEFRNGYVTLPEKDDEASFHVNNRVRLQFGYTSKRVDVVVQPQYVYVWGQNRFNAVDESAFGMHQAYAQMNLYGKGIDSSHNLELLAFRIGRQELNFDGGRILSNLDWAPQGIKHDAAIFLLKNNGWTVHAGGGFNQDGPRIFGTEFNGNMYKSFQMVRVNKKTKSFNGSLLFFKEDFQNFTPPDSTGLIVADGVNSKINAGTYLNYAINDKLSFAAEYYAQFGKNSDGRDNNAYVFNATIIGKVANGKVIIAPGVDIASGNDGLNTTDSVNRFFMPTYGINHKFYGFMDYFYTISPFGNAGLKDFHIRNTFMINPKWNTGFHIHYFMTAENINDELNLGTAANPYLGTEFDFVVNYAFTSEAKLQFGACYMTASSTMQQIKNVGQDSRTNGVFSYLQFMFTPKFL